eukprot:g16179.t1
MVEATGEPPGEAATVSGAPPPPILVTSEPPLEVNAVKDGDDGATPPRSKFKVAKGISSAILAAENGRDISDSHPEHFTPRARKLVRHALAHVNHRRQMDDEESAAASFFSAKSLGSVSSTDSGAGLPSGVSEVPDADDGTPKVRFADTKKGHRKVAEKRDEELRRAASVSHMLEHREANWGYLQRLVWSGSVGQGGDGEAAGASSQSRGDEASASAASTPKRGNKKMPPAAGGVATKEGRMGVKLAQHAQRLRRAMERVPAPHPNKVGVLISEDAVNHQIATVARALHQGVLEICEASLGRRLAKQQSLNAKPSSAGVVQVAPGVSLLRSPRARKSHETGPAAVVQASNESDISGPRAAENENSEAPQKPKPTSVSDEEAELFQRTLHLESELHEENEHTFNFQSWREGTFQRIRSAFHIAEQDYFNSFADGKDFYCISSEMAAGRSPAFFLLSTDQRFILKSCTQEDEETLLRILPAYAAHVERESGESPREPRGGAGSAPEPKKSPRSRSRLAAAPRPRGGSLLPQYLGMYTVEFFGSGKKAEEAANKEKRAAAGASTAKTGLKHTPGNNHLTFVCMTNIFCGMYKIDAKYDLKGSTVGRRSSAAERQKASPVLKDLDWLDKENLDSWRAGWVKPAALAQGGTSTPQAVSAAGEKIKTADKSFEFLLATFQRDVRFLQVQKLIDYSLLLGIHLKGDHGTAAADGSEQPSKSLLYGADEYVPPGVQTIENETTLAYVGIVDVLTPYTVRKYAETCVKGGCVRNVSCQPPSKYGDRFIDFCGQWVFTGGSGEKQDATAAGSSSVNKEKSEEPDATRV